MLEEGIEHVESEAVDASLQPASDHVELGRFDRRIPPVELGLLDQEGVHVELLANVVPLPGRSTEPGQPVVRWEGLTRIVVARRVAPQIPVGIRVVA